MSIDLANHRKSRPGRPLWSGTAFLVEALLLLVFVTRKLDVLRNALAVFAQLFAAAAGKTAESDQLARAVAAADNVAEQFAANPHAVSTVNEIDDLVVVCDVADEPRDGGVLHKATITVYERSTAEATGSVSTGDSVFSVSTARYESEVER